jgi:phosphate transport system ATP-binding protein
VVDRLHSPAASLSIGQQQRLCLARGLAVEPSFILGDEPTSSLDPQSSQNVEKSLQELKERFTIIVVTHILRQAKRIADHIVFMYLGEVIEQGPVQTFFANPQHEITRKYVQGVIS